MKQYSKPFFLFLLILIGSSLDAKSSLECIADGDEGQHSERPFLGKTFFTIPNNDNGFGMKILQDGRKIIGEFVNGKVNGYGLCHYSSGDKYIGELKNNSRHGEGVLISKIEIINGIWNDDKLIGTNINPLFGCREGDCGNNKGVQIYNDFTLYNGFFKNTKAEGEGICYYSDGAIYVGYWKEHYFDGQGIFYHKDGSKESGYWEKGQLLKVYDIPDFQEGTAPNTVTKGEVFESSVNGFATKPETVRASESKRTGAAETATGKIWAIVVGAAEYTAPTIKSLNFPDDDAYRFHSFLKSPEGGAIKDEQIRLFIDESATRANIIKSLMEFSEQATSEDVFIFYFSGHGLPGAFLPIDSDGTTNQLRYKELLEILKRSKAKSKIIIADACYSGGLINFKGEELKNSMDNYYNAIHKSQGGLVLLMSSKAEETAIENNGLRQGVFSHYLLKGLKGAANRDSDELIRINELFDYVQSNVSFYTNEYQTPMIYGDGAIDHPIGFIRHD
jgi:hypothetical protein